MSGGQLQRVSIAIALLLQPAVLISDEPTTALDPSTAEDILRLMHRLKNEFGCSVLLITHDLRIARRHADRIAVMKNGRLVEQGTTWGIMNHPEHPYTQMLVKAENKLRVQTAHDY